jgi:hypothetical protein
MSTIKITFKPRQVSKDLLVVLPVRARDVVKKRFGLEGENRMTLEAIGDSYDITRERVRQIENFALASIKKSDAFAKAQEALDELRDHVESYGSVVHEREFLAHLSKDVNFQNHIHFLLVLGDDFTKLKEDEEFNHRWTIDATHSEKVHNALRLLSKSLKDDDVLSEGEIVSMFMNHLAKQQFVETPDEETARRWLALSKQVDSNPLGGWGVADSPNIKIRGMRDLAFLILKQHGSPMHFTEVADAIKGAFGRNAHVATCHNELIKDDRFVLVGRGLYALSSWGYSKGTVRDIIKTILEKEGSLSKNDIVKKVLKERYVKENTIGVNLQNPNHFKRDDSGNYMIA